jgi:hypothetical protein
MFISDLLGTSLQLTLSQNSLYLCTTLATEYIIFTIDTFYSSVYAILLSS